MLLEAIKKEAAARILPRSDHVAARYLGTVCSYAFSYSVGRSVVGAAESLRLPGQDARILIVGPWGGRDWHWLTGFGYRPDTLDLHDHPWGPTTLRGDVSESATWAGSRGTYDLIVMCDVLEHLPRDFEALAHVRAALKPHGRFYLSVPFRHDPEPAHVRNYSDATLRRLLRLAGLEVERAWPRPGLLEAFPSLPQYVNYSTALALRPFGVSGGVLANLLAWEDRLNDATRSLFWRLGRSPQKGMIFYCSPCEPLESTSIQRARHPPV